MNWNLLLSALFALLPLVAVAQDNLVANGDMEQLTPDGSAPAVWQAAGDAATVTQKLSPDAGRQGGRSLRLQCTAIVQENPSSHAMACQVGQVGVERGKWYKVSLWAKQTNLDDTPVSIALSNTQGWSNLGLSSSLQIGPDWEQFELTFQATGSCRETTRFQIWFTTPGTLWLDDVSFRETAPERTGPTLVWPAEGRRNLLPNAGFEVGTEGWGSTGDFPTRGWALPMNALFGEVVTEGARQGSRCFRMAITPENLPVDYFDYFGMTRQPAKSLLVGSVGWMPTTPGTSYCFSAWVRASRDDVPVRLQVSQFRAGVLSRQVQVGKDWQRFQLVVKPTSQWCYVAAGPVLDQPDAVPVTVWLDGLQFEAGDQPTDNTARDAVEAGLSTSRDGNVFMAGEPVALDLAVSNTSTEPANLEVTVTDFNDQTVSRKSFQVPAGTALWRQTVDPGLAAKGFYRAHLSVNGQEKPRGLRFAVIPRYQAKDSIFGVNHAYPWPHLLKECVSAGILWVRDWSVKWQDVQPAPDAPFDFTETDYQIDRPISFGQQVLTLLPFPSANWSSSAPEDVKVGPNYPENRQRQAFSPRSDAEFSRWVAETVRHYRGRTTWYQVFNEPVYTDYSLPRSRGYSGTDYGRLVKVFAKAAREADPDCRILAGIGGWPSSVERMFRDMFDQGALDAIDAVDVHTYPGLTPPEATEKGLTVLRDLMQQHGKVKPIWLTEHGYYSDDDFEQTPIRRGGFSDPLPSERVQAEFSMRFNVILLANGVERIFYHAGTCPGLNADNTEGVFFEYGGAPRKIYTAVAAFADLFRPGVKPLGEWDWGKQSKAYLFRSDDRLILATWVRNPRTKMQVSWTDERIVARDLMGNDLTAGSVELTTAPVFLVTRDMTPEALEQSLKHVP